MMKLRTTDERGLIMDYKIFNKLDIEKQIDIYNQWLCDSKLEEYALYPNTNEGLESLFERSFSQMISDIDIANELTHSKHYDISDSIITYDIDIKYGFKSLTDNDIKERFENQDFLGWLEGQRLENYA